jgi:hypothetical protein
MLAAILFIRMVVRYYENNLIQVDDFAHQTNGPPREAREENTQDSRCNAAQEKKTEDIGSGSEQSQKTEENVFATVFGAFLRYTDTKSSSRGSTTTHLGVPTQPLFPFPLYEPSTAASSSGDDSRSHKLSIEAYQLEMRPDEIAPKQSPIQNQAVDEHGRPTQPDLESPAESQLFRQHDSIEIPYGRLSPARPDSQTLYHARLHQRRGRHVQPLNLSSSLYVNSGSPQSLPLSSTECSEGSNAVETKRSLRDFAAHHAKVLLQCFRPWSSRSRSSVLQESVYDRSVGLGIMYVDERDEGAIEKKKEKAFGTMRRMLSVRKAKKVNGHQ